ncbi:MULTISPECIES: acyl-CoA dehydrogenase [unclassified Staphylococcus]|uniref:acyl-CoA dehydrogenase n=1 Tax=unclassified Staphylococcus TaxID=91994 RepID=UPI0021D3AD7E|nr:MULTISPECIES: acyl-CoA dehydrogenase [unclassified Staphylococcus]UXR78614.1 acyl-CoA dehydrogenase [Staphylococcus sp. IVB6227]UXR82772.1 acyl-CoA dehydrogenase [Staphylococcus sp. IVB6214]
MSLNTHIEKKLEPYLIEIDAGSYYPKDFISTLFKEGYFKDDDVKGNSEIIEKVSKSCLTTAFCLWCQLAFSTYLKNAEAPYFNQHLQQQLLSGKILGATGLSNPMKSFNDLETFNLSHHYNEQQQLIVNGRLPAISNIGPDHYFGAISKSTSSDELVMFIVQANQTGITMTEMSHFLGVNGSATFSIEMHDVLIPEKHIITHDAKTFATQIRPQFVALQIPIALGAIRASLDLIQQFSHAQNGINQYLEYDVQAFENQYNQIRQRFYAVLDEENLQNHFETLITLKKAAGYLLLDVNQASMVNGGSKAYGYQSPQVRKLKEGFFFAALTPTLRHLGKLQEALKASND